VTDTKEQVMHYQMGKLRPHVDALLGEMNRIQAEANLTTQEIIAAALIAAGNGLAQIGVVIDPAGPIQTQLQPLALAYTNAIRHFRRPTH
jgi:hypothetical protein